MPWKDLRVEQQRLLMIQDHEEGASISELAEIYGISRKTVYKWLERHEDRGVAGLADASRRPHESPNQVSAEVEAAIVENVHQSAADVMAASEVLRHFRDEGKLTVIEAEYDLATGEVTRLNPAP